MYINNSLMELLFPSILNGQHFFPQGHDDLEKASKGPQSKWIVKLIKLKNIAQHGIWGQFYNRLWTLVLFEKSRTFCQKEELKAIQTYLLAICNLPQVQLTISSSYPSGEEPIENTLKGEASRGRWLHESSVYYIQVEQSDLLLLMQQSCIKQAL